MHISHYLDIYHGIRGFITAGKVYINKLNKPKKALVSRTLSKNILAAIVVTAVLLVPFYVLNAQVAGGPLAVTNIASNITRTGATLNGYVDPYGVSGTTVWFEWGNSPSVPLTNRTTSGTFSSPANFNFILGGLSVANVYYYRAVAQNSNGTSYGEVQSFYTLDSYGNYYYGYGTTATGGWGTSGWGTGTSNWSGNLPIVNTNSASLGDTYAILSGYIDPNGVTDTVHWFEWGTNQYSLTNYTSRAVQSYPGTFSDTISNVSRGVQYYYRAVAQNPNGTTYGQVMNFALGYGTVSGGQGYGYGAVNTSGLSLPLTTVTTNEPASIIETAARFNGLVILNGTAVQTNGYFEWGATPSLGNSTAPKSLGGLSSMAFNEYVTNLSPDTRYYYRAVAQNQYGTFKGSTQSFKTLGGISVAAPAPVQVAGVATVKTTASAPGTGLVKLSMESDSTRVALGDHVTLTAAYTNTSKQTLENSVLRVELPAEFSYRDSSRGVYSNKDNSVTIDLGALGPNESSEVVVKTDVTQNITSDKTLMVKANMVYTESTGRQDETVAYALLKPNPEAKGVALAFFGNNNFFPTSFLGWLSLMVVILLLIIISRYMYGTYTSKRQKGNK